MTHNPLHNGRIIRHGDATTGHRNHFMDLAPGHVAPPTTPAAMLVRSADDDMLRWVGHPRHLSHPDDKETT